VSATAVEVTARDLHDIERAVWQIKVAGAPYSEAAQRMINR